MNKLNGYLSAMCLAVNFSAAVFIDNQLDEEIYIETQTTEIQQGYLKKQSVAAKGFVFHPYDDELTKIRDYGWATDILSVSAKKHGVCQLKNKPGTIDFSKEDRFAAIVVKPSDNGGCEVWFEL